MKIHEIIKDKKISQYKLAKNSGVPYATISDICSGKTQLEKCNAETIYRIAKALDVTMEELVEPYIENRIDFELYKSNVCHRLREMGDIDFIISTIEQDDIRRYYKKRWYPESLYLLAMLDYISRENDIELCEEYDDLRKRRLSEIIYPASVLALCVASKSDEPKQQAYREAIPEFMRFNIVEGEVRNVI